jgi:membrane fusion protein (multidrug efflux system)
MNRLEQAEVAVESAAAATAAATASVSSANANLRTVQSSVESAKIRVWRADKEFSRISNLQQQGAGTAQQFDAAKAEKEAADALLVTANRQLEAAAAAVDAAEKQARVATVAASGRKIDESYAKLQHSYTCILAPVSGTASKKNIQVGQLVGQGAPLFVIVSDEQPYVVANFKETQIGEMKIGQSVEVKVDAFPDHLFHGTVSSFSPATGAKFSLLPPDNATGNYVKVVQRVPVRIQLAGDTLSGSLRPGMSVHVSVTTKD